MFSIPLESLPLSKREKAKCIRTDLINAAQILYATSSEHDVRHLFDLNEAAKIGQITARCQAPKFSSVLGILESSGEGSSVSSKELVKSECDSDMTTRERPTATDEAFKKACSGLYLRTGDGKVDELLGGGLRRGCLTEIVGESACGKTQLAMQTALFTALGLTTLEEDDIGIDAPIAKGQNDLYTSLRGCGIRPVPLTNSVVFINSGGDTTSRQIIRRMDQMLRIMVEERWVQSRRSSSRKKSTKRPRREGDVGRSSGTFLEEEDCASTLRDAMDQAQKQLWENVHLSSPKDYESLEHVVTYQLPVLSSRIRRQSKVPIGLVIIDDLPSFFIEENDDAATQGKEGWIVKRSRLLCEISDKLKRFAVSCCGDDKTISSPFSSTAIMVMNQVIDTFASNAEVLRTAVIGSRSIHMESFLQGSTRPVLSSSVQEGFYNGVLASVDAFAIEEAQLRLSQSKKENQISHDKEEEEVLQFVKSASKMASLGHTWANCINVRIMLAHTKRQVHVKQDRGEGGGRWKRFTLRRAVSVINPFARAGEGGDFCVEYIIQERGFVSLSNCRIRTVLDDEEQLWSSFDNEISTADLSSLMDSEEQDGSNRKEGGNRLAEMGEDAEGDDEEEGQKERRSEGDYQAPFTHTTYDEDDELWQTSLDLDSWRDLPTL
ncbi:hypothetical protein CBS101457_006813 [Exobasidium rhododendri]|nr:hypothetical protein CBS101457_006813 [Exobasidium rhododendri]